MSRNLIEAKAWEGGRREICVRCRHFAGPSAEAPKYEWQNCRRLNDSNPYSCLWEAGKCRDFQVR